MEEINEMEEIVEMDGLDSFNKDTCTICYNDLINTNTCITNCSHSFCKDCLHQWFNRGKLSCPLCREDIQYFNYKSKNIKIVCITKPSIRSTINMNNRIIIYRNVCIFWSFFTSLLALSSGLSFYYICVM